MFLQVGVGLREGFAAEKAAVGRQGGGVRRSEDEVAAAVDERAFFLCVAAPEDEDEVFALFGQAADDGVGKGFPAQCGVGVGLAGADGEDGVEQEDALFRPVLQAAVVRDAETGDVVGKFFVDVLQGGRDVDARTDGKGQSVRLSFAVVGVLAEDDGFDLAKFGGFEGVEDVGGRRIDGLPAFAFGFNGVDDVSEIGLLLFFAEGFCPGLHHDFVGGVLW